MNVACLIPVARIRGASTLPRHSVEQAGFVDVACARAMRAYARLTYLGRTLTRALWEFRDKRQQLEDLTRTNARLKKKVKRLRCEVARARHFAYHDPLTGLPNRCLLMDRLNQVTVMAARQGRPLALLLLDLDGFKSVNDSLGHAAGDEILQQVAERLSACIRGCDTACRYGGDEFVIMLPEIDSRESADAVAHKIADRLAAPYSIDGAIVSLTASIGAAIYRPGAQGSADLIRQADVAMYLAKSLGKPSRPIPGA
jgi:diguanylate cyclase (GGDEF)-like protein